MWIHIFFISFTWSCSVPQALSTLRFTLSTWTPGGTIWSWVKLALSYYLAVSGTVEPCLFFSFSLCASQRLLSIFSWSIHIFFSLAIPSLSLFLYPKFFHFFLFFFCHFQTSSKGSLAHPPEYLLSILKDLHWWHIRKRIEFKILLLTFKYIQGCDLLYKRELF